ncbi:MAG: 30S ribosomal protein S8 [Bdellovibrionales bacterium]|nr:30S ribosomal protein S8 [Bdellovibrionales bacterium]
MYTDPIADLLTRIRNACSAGHVSTTIPASKQKEAILTVLKEEGFIGRFERRENGAKPTLEVFLRYMNNGKPVIQELTRLSKPGRRRYVGKTDIPKFKGGLGVVVVSTSQGVMSDQEARKRGVGGELICSVF